MVASLTSTSLVGRMMEILFLYQLQDFGQVIQQISVRIAEPKASAVCATWDIISGTGNHSSKLPQSLVLTILVDELTEAGGPLSPSQEITCQVIEDQDVSLQDRILTFPLCPQVCGGYNPFKTFI